MATSNTDISGFSPTVLASCPCGKPVSRPGAKWCKHSCWKRTESNRTEHNKQRPSRAHRHGKYNSKFNRQPIGVDGEGEHGRYTLLAASDGSGIERYIQNRKGLSTNACLDFLINLPRTRFVWGFAFSYDINMLLGSVPISELTRLAKTGRVFYGDWRIAHIPGKTLTITHRPTKRTVTVWDMYPWIQSSFVAMLEKFELTDAKTIARIKLMKDKREEFANLSMAKIRGYCLEECSLLSKAVRMLLDLILASGYKCNTFYSPGSLAAAAMGAHNILAYRSEITDANLLEAINEAYFGGRSEVSIVGPVVGPLFEYDIHSAYPFAATLLPCFAHGSWEKYRPGDSITDWTLVNVQWQTKQKAIWGPFPVRPPVGSLRFPTVGNAWIWGKEARIGSQLCKEFNILDGWHFIPGCNHKPFLFLSEIYERRRTLIDQESALEYVYKLILNSTYGKLAQKIIREDQPPKWRYLPWAGLITSITRSMLLEQIIAIGQNNIILCATDCVITRKELKVELSDSLGAWEKHDYADMFIAGPGFYYAGNYIDKEPKIRNRGIARTHVRFDDLQNAWKKSGREAVVNIHTRRFVGYRQALAYKQTDALWRQFIDIKLKKTITVEPRRQWFRHDVMNGRSLAPTPSYMEGKTLSDMLQFLTMEMHVTKGHGTPEMRLAAADALAKWTIFDTEEQPDWLLDELNHG